MSETRIKLIGPSEGLREACLGFLEEFQIAGETYGSDVIDQVRKDCGAFVRERLRWSQGLDLPKGRVPESTYLLVRERHVIGAATLSHRLTDALRDWGGHVRYGVRPSERNKGYGTLMLKLVLVKALELGIGRVLVTCDKSNIASARVIQKNDGVLDSESYSEQSGRITQRYWIELEQGAQDDVCD